MNEKEAEFIGILLGDGYIEPNFKQVKISLNSNTDKEYSIYLKDLIKELYGIEANVSKRTNENTLDIRITKRWFSNHLINEVGMISSPKLFNVKIPKKYFKQKFFIYLIRGLFDTDGCLVVTNNNGTLYPRLEIKVSESPMKYQLIYMLKKLKFNFGVYKSNKNQVRIQMNGLGQLRQWLDLIGFSNMKHKHKLHLFPSKIYRIAEVGNPVKV